MKCRTRRYRVAGTFYDAGRGRFRERRCERVLVCLREGVKDSKQKGKQAHLWIFSSSRQALAVFGTFPQYNR